MAINLFVNTAASLGSALVRSLTDNSPISLGDLVVGDGKFYNLYFTDGRGGYAEFSGDPSYIPYIAIGECGHPSGGTFTATFGANTTAALAYNISPAALQTALQGLASIGSGNATVVGVAGQYYIVTFVGALANTDVAEITCDFDGMTPASTIDVSTIVIGGGGNNEVQLLNLATNPITFADDWTPITNGWTGQLSLRTVEIIEAFALAGGTIEQVFQITVADPLGIRTTWLKIPASIQCTIINPESFAGADKPLLATQAALNAAVLGNNNFTQESLASSATGNTNVTRSSTSRFHRADITETGTAGTRTFAILTTNSPNVGCVVLIRINTPATAGIVNEIRNATSGGTLLATFTTTGDEEPIFVLLGYDGSAWAVEYFSGDYLSKVGNLASLENVAESRVNLSTLYSKFSTQTANFTVTADDDGTLFLISTAAGAVVATIPAASAVDVGFRIALQKTEGSPQIVTTSPATASLFGVGQTVELVSDGTTWWVTNNYNPGNVPITLTQAVLNWPTVIGLTGGTATDLDGQATANGALGNYATVLLVMGTIPTLTKEMWQLRPGTDVETDGIIRPDDFDASTNARVWVQID